MNSTWQKQISRRKVFSKNNPDYYVSWVVDNVPPPLWLTEVVCGNVEDSIYTDLSMRLGEMGLSQ